MGAGAIAGYFGAIVHHHHRKNSIVSALDQGSTPFQHQEVLLLGLLALICGIIIFLGWSCSLKPKSAQEIYMLRICGKLSVVQSKMFQASGVDFLIITY